MRSCSQTSYHLIGYSSDSVKLPDLRPRDRAVVQEIKGKRQQFTPSHKDIVAVQTGPINLAHIPFAPTKDIDNEMNGIQKRLIHEHSKPSATLVKEIANFVKTYILPNITPLEPGVQYEQLKKEWDASGSYSLKRRQQLDDMAHEYIATWGEGLPKDPAEFNKLFSCKMFMKEEFYPEQKHVRMIVSRSDLYKSVVGPYIHRFDHDLFHGTLSDHFIKGKSPEWKAQRMEQIEREYPLYMETDYSSFEGSQCVEIQRAIEMQTLLHYFKYYPHIQALLIPLYEYNPDVKFNARGEPKLDSKPKAIYDPLTKTWHNKQYTSSIFNLYKKGIYSHSITSAYHRLWMQGNRKSGEMWTSSGNGLTNLTIMKFLAYKKGVVFDGIVEGDDGFFGMYDDKIKPTDYTELGFSIKLNYETDPNMLSFCGFRFTRDGTFVVKPESANRTGWCEKKKYFNAGRKMHLKLLKAKAMSLLAQAPNCPIMSALATSLIRNIKVQANFNVYDNYYEKEMKTKWIDTNKLNALVARGPVISDSARTDFSIMFSVPVEKQIAIENSFMQNPFDNFWLPLFDGGELMKSYTEGLFATGPDIVGHMICQKK